MAFLWVLATDYCLMALRLSGLRKQLDIVRRPDKAQPPSGKKTRPLRVKMVVRFSVVRLWR